MEQQAEQHEEEMEQKAKEFDCTFAWNNLLLLKSDMEREYPGTSSEPDWDKIYSLAGEALDAIEDKRCDDANELIAQARDLLRELPGVKVMDPVSPDKLPRFK